MYVHKYVHNCSFMHKIPTQSHPQIYFIEIVSLFPKIHDEMKYASQIKITPCKTLYLRLSYVIILLNQFCMPINLKFLNRGKLRPHIYPTL